MQISAATYPPELATGKDSSALPVPPTATPGTTEERLAAIWANVLEIPKIGYDDDFFELDGDSLLATQIVARMRATFGVEMPLHRFFDRPTVAAQAKEIERMCAASQNEAGGANGASGTLVSATRDEYLPASHTQQVLWMYHQLGSPLIIRLSLRIAGPLDVLILERSINEIVRRHEILRTTLNVTHGKQVQVIAPELTLRLTPIDLTVCSSAEQEAEMRRVEGEAILTPFNVTRGPLIRARLMRLGAQEHVLLIAQHHIITDGWSCGIFVRELATLYEAFSQGYSAPLSDLPVQYADYVAWQQQSLDSTTMERLWGFWSKQFAGAPVAAMIPPDHPECGEESRSGATYTRLFSSDLHAQAQAISQQEHATLFMTFLTVFGVLLAEMSGVPDLLISTPIAGRTQAEVEAVMGCFADVAVLRINVQGDPTFRELLGRVREMALGVYAHQQMPSAELPRRLRQTWGDKPLYHVMFSMNDVPVQRLKAGAVTIQRQDFDDLEAQIDVRFRIEESASGLRGFMCYHAGLYEPKTAAHVLELYQTLLESLLAHPDEPISSVLMK